MQHSSPPQNPHSYTAQLLKKLSLTYQKHSDIMLNATLTLPLTPNPHRQQILFGQYPMQKKGKKFGTVEERNFRIDNGIIKQVDQNGQQRELPMPNFVKRQQIYAVNRNQWGFQEYGYRLYVEFSQRNPIYIYLRSAEQQLQIYSFLHSKAYSYSKQILKNAYQKCYKQKILNYFITKFTKLRISRHSYNQPSISIQNRKVIVLSKLKTMYDQKRMTRELVYEWQRKAVMTKKDDIGSNSSSVVNVKNIVSELCFIVKNVKIIADGGVEMGEMKVWVGQSTFGRPIRFTQEQRVVSQFQIKKNNKNNNNNNTKNQNNQLNTINIFEFSNKDNQIKIRNESPPLSIWTVLQFQIETKNKQGDSQVWKSDKFYVLDLLKSLSSSLIKTVTLNTSSSSNHMLLLLQFTSARSQLLPIQIPPMHHQFPTSYTYSLTPNHYPLLNSIIPYKILHKYIKNQSTTAIHLQYMIAFQEYIQMESIGQLGFCNYYKLADILQIQSIVEKFYSTPPYCEYINVEYKGTFVYQMLVQKASKFAYYDAQKFIWKYQCRHLRRFLSAIKAFDQFPRINFTQPFFHLCLQCLSISQSQSLLFSLKHKTPLFAPSILGRQSLAFFLVLGILKSASSLLLYQINKSTLSNNSLLFHYVFKKYRRQLYDRFLKMQVNVEAMFGIQAVGFFCGLGNYWLGDSIIYEGNNGNQMFVFLVSAFAQQRKQQSSKLQQLSTKATSSTSTLQQQLIQTRSNHNITLIAYFLAILQLFDTVMTNKCKKQSQNNDNNNVDDNNDGAFDDDDNVEGDSGAYCTAHGFIQYFKIFVSVQLQKYMLQVIVLFKKYSKICQQQFKIVPTSLSKSNPNPKQPYELSQYLKLQQNVHKFHMQNNPSLLPQSPSPYPSPTSTSASNSPTSIKQSPPPSPSLQQQQQQQQAPSIANMGLGELLEQIYSQFMCYRHKNQQDIRKICVLIDHVDLGQTIHNNSNISNSANSTYGNSSGGYRPASLLIQLHQSSIKIYQHQYILPSSSYSSSTHLVLQNLKRPIQLKLNRLQPLTLTLTHIHQSQSSSFSSSSQSYCTILNPRELPSNHYLQLIRELIPVNIVNTSGFIQKNCQISSSRSIHLQVFIKDSCQVDYLENSVPNQYINLLLLRDKLGQAQQEYKRDVLFCNQFFRSFRLVDNNFNILYAKLGWYGNHYLVPQDRLNSINISVQNNKLSPSTSSPQQQPQPASSLTNSQSALSSLCSSTPQLSLVPLPQPQLHKLHQILYFTRCVYGRGIIPSLSYSMPSSSTINIQLISEIVRNNTKSIKQCRSVKNQINQFQYNCVGGLICYPLENFSTVNSGVGYQLHHQGCNNSNNNIGYHQHARNCFVDFYVKATQQLPLIRYLAFRPLQFYLLQQIKITLRVPSLSGVPSSTNSSPSSHPQSSASSLPKSNKNISAYEHSTTTPPHNSTRVYQIVLTNHPITSRMYGQNNVQNMPYQFISDCGYADQIYANYTAKDGFNNNIGKEIYQMLTQGIHLPNVMFFTYPQAIFHNSNHNGKNDQTESHDGISNYLSRQMLVDQFLWLLKNNIHKHYVSKILHTRAQTMNKSQKQKQIKMKQKQKSKQKNKLNVLDMKMQFMSPCIPNMSISDLYQMTLQTKLALQLHAYPITPINFQQHQNLTSSSLTLTPKHTSLSPSSSHVHISSSSSLLITPIYLNPIHRHYTSFTLLDNIWKQVCILGKLVSPSHQFYYVQQKYTRKYRLVKINDTVLAMEAKRMMDRVPTSQFTDLEVVAGKDCVNKWLTTII